MRSRQTGQVGSSIKAGVGGGMGFVERFAAAVAGEDDMADEGTSLEERGVKGSFRMSGKELSSASGWSGGLL